VYTRALGFSIEPPRWLRDLGAQILSETHVQIPGPGGIPIIIDLSNPAQLDQVKRMLLGTRVTVGQPKGPIDRLATEAEKPANLALILGGVAAVGGAIWLLSQISHRKG
jgi:hypothetical protein